MENLALYLVVTLAALLIILNSIATYIVCHTYFEVKERRQYQILFTWLVPFVGSLLTIFINKEDYFAQKHENQVGNNPNITESQAVHYASAARHRGGR
ncbi:MAG: hypothetical protein GY820_23495 [Gammaproteobacteria bacterium]|nr:hypothetical protein [Alteromonas sp.]MCP4490256.1 hypothetical protein [Gammaproteobacteria bacterium]